MLRCESHNGTDEHVEGETEPWGSTQFSSLAKVEPHGQVLNHGGLEGAITRLPRMCRRAWEDNLDYSAAALVAFVRSSAKQRRRKRFSFALFFEAETLSDPP